MIKGTSRFISVLLVALLLLTGVTTAFAAPVHQGDQTLMEVARGQERFETFVQGVETTGLIDTLEGEGPFTVFIPTDEAFDEALPPGTLASDIVNAEKILSYHVVPGRLAAADLTGVDNVETLLGESLEVIVDGNTVTVGGAAVVEADIDASNGTIHVIDNVLTPPSSEGEGVVMEEGPQAILEFARQDEQLETFVQAVEATGLVETLSDEGPFTVFVPTDEAFSALPETSLTDLMVDSTPLADVLRYHVVPNRILTADVETTVTALTVLDEPLDINFAEERIFVNDAEIVRPDIQLSNGVIHVIDQVLVPSAVEEPEAMTVPATEGVAVTCAQDYVVQADDWLSKIAEKSYGDPLAYPAIFEATNAAAAAGLDYDVIDDPNVIEIGQTFCLPSQEDAEALLADEEQIIAPQAIAGTLSDDGRFNTLVEALTTAELVETLQGEGPFTLFAPTDEAFNALPEGEMTNLLNNPTALQSVLQYHLVAGQLMADEVAILDTLESSLGQTLDVVSEGEAVTINQANVIDPNIMASNGVIHAIDTVLMPTEEAAMMEDAPLEEETQVNIIEAAVKDGRFDTFVEAAQAAGVADLLQEEGPYTVFVPTDEAFDALGDRLPDLLQQPEELANVLRYHVVPETLTTEDLLGRLDMVETLSGEMVDLTLTEDVLRVNEAQVIDADIETNNGIIHVIDGVLLPPAE